MQAEGIIAAVIGVLAGGGGVRTALRFGPERKDAIARYYQRVIKDLREENETLWEHIHHLEQRVEDLRHLEDRITELEVAQDEPPPYLA